MGLLMMKFSVSSQRSLKIDANLIARPHFTYIGNTDLWWKHVESISIVVAASRLWCFSFPHSISALSILLAREKPAMTFTSLGEKGMPFLQLRYTKNMTYSSFSSSLSI